MSNKKVSKKKVSKKIASNNSEEVVDSLAHMFTHINPFIIQDTHVYELERIFYTYHKLDDKPLIVKSMGVYPVSVLQESTQCEMYNRYVRGAKILGRDKPELVGIQLSFLEF